MTVLSLNSRQQVFSCRDLIPPQPDSLWRIERGIIRTMTWNEAGAISTLGYWGPGDVVGQSLSRVIPYQIECWTSVEVTMIPADLWCHMLDAILLHTQQTEELLNIVHQPRVPLRLLKLLGWLAQKFGRPVKRGILIDLPLTHQAIAEVISTTRVTVTRLLETLEQEGRIQRYQRHIILLSDRCHKVAV